MAHLTAPDPKQKKFPGGVPFIIGNEVAERFSFYGMKGILTVFMTQHMLNASGEAAYMDDERARGWYHLFTGLTYTFPLVGAIIADVFLGKYRTILFISLMYCVGHGLLAMMDVAPSMGMDMQMWLIAGMLFIAIGAGAIKPCVSAHVGDQFGTGNKHLLTQVFNWFYFSINVGAATSMFLTPILLAKVGPWLAFGLPGVLMAIATFTFWLGRNRFVHVPAAGWAKWKAETFSPEGKRALKWLAPLFLIFVMMFWAIFDQTGSAWVLQSESLNRNFMGLNWLESQIQFVNPVLILSGIPIFTYILYPFVGKFYKLTPLRKIGIGFVFTAMSFVLSAFIEMMIADKAPGVSASLWGALAMDGEMPNKLPDIIQIARDAGWTQDQLNVHTAAMPSIAWQFLAYLILTSGEIMVSIVCLEFAYTQSPKKMKSFVMGVFFMGVAIGNYLAMGVNFALDRMKDEQGNTPMDGATYYLVFAGAMFFTTAVYLVWVRSYKGQEFIQGEDEAATHAEAEAEGLDIR
ncbi:MAG: POT family proton-dependent oligopeptide transporter [Phycisphaerales bacterium]|jgi:POT family proton-dependent oligopeptide transporter